MMTREEFEALEREFEEQMATPLPRAKPKVAVVTVPLSEKDAAVIAANPESVRVSARREDRRRGADEASTELRCESLRRASARS